MHPYLSRAAEYVRMSTDQQQFSVAYQQAAIRLYAVQHGLAVVRTYADEGLSGLTLRERPAMKQLLADVETGATDYDVILVYDVSRWGRFQDTDEGAYHEFRCRQAGKRVEYCAEQFSNDGGLLNAVWKAIKRAMAAEYSRELAVRTASAQARATAQGFLHGGIAGYGLRRMLIDAQGRPKGLLETGVHKAARTDRVILVPGPEEELAVIRRIFDMYVTQHMFIQHIADQLNRDGVRSPRGLTWNHQSIRTILRNERYTGQIVFNKSTSNLRLGKGDSGRVKNPPIRWVRGKTQYPPIVAPEIFAAANNVKERKAWWYRDDEVLLQPLRSLWNQHGYLSMALIDSAKGLPNYGTYLRRFGSIKEAYRRIGYQFRPNYMHSEKFRAHHDLISHLAVQLSKAAKRKGFEATWEWRARRLKLPATGWDLGIGIARLFQSRSGSYWAVHTRHSAKPDFLLVAKMDDDIQLSAEWYVLPSRIIAGEYAYLDNPKYEIFRYKGCDAAIRSLVKVMTTPKTQHL